MPGLKLAIRLADQPFVFHDRTARTFHPKLYLAEGPDKAILLAGSSNLTAGGLFSNYEASLEAEFELPEEIDAAALVGCGSTSRYCWRMASLLPLDEELLERLIQDPKYAIAQSERRLQAEASEASPDGIAQTAEAGEKRLRHQSARQAPGSRDAARGSGGLERSSKRPWSSLGPSACRRRMLNIPLPPKSNPVGNLRLTTAGNSIDRRTSFREDMFGAASWSSGEDSKGNPIEIATVRFLVTIAGQSHGTMGLRVDHAPHRESDQHNHATVLHGPVDAGASSHRLHGPYGGPPAHVGRRLPP